MKKKYKGWVMYCNSLCKCDIMSITLDRYEYTIEEKQNPNIRIEEVDITITQRKKEKIT